ncbi:hypothetical protein Dsin_007489 [Dipteronia sinensis]|uniref:Potassium channel tetramerisation-type BTB domain-containing protein n=1 Tax=Dipteronia sinensis TaxID=43782 RepID=A0AAE0B0N0_9ROSI|nr:hypothetical protein Dsin_007489 [Dipteronia sinensis]
MLSSKSIESNVVTIDVGGQIFQTTKQTLSSAGPKSILSRLAESTHRFIDRDPELFSVLLSLLRTGNLPVQGKGFRRRRFDRGVKVLQHRVAIDQLPIEPVSVRCFQSRKVVDFAAQRPGLAFRDRDDPIRNPACCSR